VPNKQAIQAEAQRGQKMLEDHSRYLEDQYRDWKARRTLFPSTMPGSRGATSPLDGRSPDWEWSGRKKGD
jgi:hypothetical protein